MSSTTYWTLEEAERLLEAEKDIEWLGFYLSLRERGDCEHVTISEGGYRGYGEDYLHDDHVRLIISGCWDVVYHASGRCNYILQLKRKKL